MGSCVGIEGLDIENQCPDITDTRCIEEVLLSKSKEEREEMYGPFWHACAGSMVNIPQVGEKVFYFPQGHLEQVEAYTKQETSCKMPFYDLPPRILCKVIYVQLKVEVDTDEVFAQVTLIPSKEEEPLVLTEKSRASPQKSRFPYFSKVLTPSDTSVHGGFSVLRRHAIECLPPLDLTQNPPSQELVAKDLHGVEWRFRHIYRGQPKRHLLTSGWSTFVGAKRLVPGDTFIFMRGENGEFRVGVRHGIKIQTNVFESIMSSHSIQLGVLATASHALSTHSIFSVFYRPRNSPSEFLISCDQYLKSVQTKFTVGVRFRMKFEGVVAFPEERPAGTIVGVKDVDPVRWPSSQWKSLVVKWDKLPATILRPGRVSPWTIVPLVVTKVRSVHPRTKKPRTSARLPVGSSASAKHGLLQLSSVEPTPLGHSMVLQSQEIHTIGAQARIELNSSIGNLVPPPKSIMLENPLHSRMKNPVTHNHGNISSTFIGDFGLDSYSIPSFSAYLNSDDAPLKENLLSNPNTDSYNSGLDSYSIPSFSAYLNSDDAPLKENLLSNPNTDSYNSGLHEWSAPDPNRIVLTPINQLKENGTCMLFGVSLGKRPFEPAPPGVVISNELPKPFPVTNKFGSQSGISFSDQNSEQSRTKNMSHSGGNDNASGKLCKNCCNANRGCIKVKKYGTLLGRTVDLMKFNSYNELLGELDRMFAFDGGLVDMSNVWNVIYLDEDGDIMQLGDSPWVEFRLVVRKMFIFPKDEILKLKVSSWDLKLGSPNPN